MDFRRAELAQRASRLAAQLLGQPARPVDRATRMTRTLVFLETADTLVVAAGTDDKPLVHDSALPWGLLHQGDRDLMLLLPASSAWQVTTRRLAWIATPVRVFTHDGELLTERAIEAPVDVRTALPSLLPKEVRPHRLDPMHRDWLSRVFLAVPSLESAPRSSYRAWHHQGRQVLRVRRTRTGLQLVAGVDHTKPGPGRPAALRATWTDAPTPTELDRVIGAVEQACASREGDERNVEHRLQAILDTAEGLRALGLVPPLLRELPGRRMGGSRAFVDLVGVDARGRIHIVETKLARDYHLAMQGLDYFAWLTGSLGEVVSLLRQRGHRLPDEPQVLLDLVVGTPSGRPPPLDALLPQLEALAGSVRWRIGVLGPWQDQTPTITWYPRHAPPDVRRRPQPPRFVCRLQARLMEKNGGRVFRDVHEELVHPRALPALRALASAGRTHRYVHHVRSSQAFALCLFAGLSAAERLAIARELLPRAEAVEEVELEYEDPDDTLDERGRTGHQTQVDVLMRCQTPEGPHLLLIEVKLSEDDFSHCTGALCPANPHRDACRTDAPFGEPERCARLQDRAYDRFVPTEALGVGPQCPFRRSGYQVMRNVALAAVMLERGEGVRASYVLCAPAGHGSIWRRFRRVQQRVRLPAGVHWASLAAEQVLDRRSGPVRDWMTERYG